MQANGTALVCLDTSMLLSQADEITPYLSPIDYMNFIKTCHCVYNKYKVSIPVKRKECTVKFVDNGKDCISRGNMLPNGNIDGLYEKLTRYRSVISEDGAATHRSDVLYQYVYSATKYDNGITQANTVSYKVNSGKFIHNSIDYMNSFREWSKIEINSPKDVLVDNNEAPIQPPEDTHYYSVSALDERAVTVALQYISTYIVYSYSNSRCMCITISNTEDYCPNRDTIVFTNVGKEINYDYDQVTQQYKTISIPSNHPEYYRCNEYNYRRYKSLQSCA